LNIKNAPIKRPIKGFGTSAWQSAILTTSNIFIAIPTDRFAPIVNATIELARESTNSPTAAKTPDARSNRVAPQRRYRSGII